MLAKATVTVDLDKISENASRVHAMLPGIAIVGVTKVTCGSPEVARAMLAGGCSAIGESRLENIERLRDAGITAPFWLIRASPPGLAADTVRLADVSLESECVTLDALSAAAVADGRTHSVVAMVDLGDLREGRMPADVPAFVEHADSLAGLTVAGLGTSLTCYGAVVPSRENLGTLVSLATQAGAVLGRDLLVSGGMSSSIDLALAGGMPAGVTDLRIGESILLGVSTVTREPLVGLHTDAITAAAPVIECALKPSAPSGEIAQDAFGGRPVSEDRGMRWRAILAIGRQDVDPEGIRLLDRRMSVLGASSDHLIVDVHDVPERPAIGDAVRFVPNYSATLRLFSSAYVVKDYIGLTDTRRR